MIPLFIYAVRVGYIAFTLHHTPFIGYPIIVGYFSDKKNMMISTAGIGYRVAQKPRLLRKEPGDYHVLSFLLPDP